MLMEISLTYIFNIDEIIINYLRNFTYYLLHNINIKSNIMDFKRNFKRKRSKYSAALFS